MADARPDLTYTNFRARYERARRLNPGRQLEECVDYLQNPELLIDELLDAFFAIDIASAGETNPLRRPDADPEELTLEYFYETLEVTVLDTDPYRFTCMASDLDPSPRPDDFPEDDRLGLDYVGRIEPPRGGIALGAVRSECEATPYLVLLRLLSCLVELAPASRLERLHREILRSGGEPDPALDLHLVLWEADDGPGVTSLAQLTHDLANVVKEELQEAWQFPKVLRDIVCLRMDADDFDSRLRVDWKV